MCELGAAGLNNDAASKSTWAVVDYSHASKAARRPGGGPLAATTTRMVLLKNRCSALGSLLRHRAKLPLYVLKAAEGNTPFLSSSRYRTGMPRCCDPSRALASLKPNLVAMLTNPRYDLPIHHLLEALVRSILSNCQTAGLFLRLLHRPTSLASIRRSVIE